MNSRRALRLFLAATIAVAGAASSRAQCLEWAPGFGIPGTDSPIYALAEFNDGSGGGPALYLGGSFTLAGDKSLAHIAKWDGATWSDVGGGLNGIVRALTVYDDGFGGGPALFAAGDFTLAGGISASHIAKWNGTSWSPLGSGVNSTVRALTVSNVAGSSALFVGGDFSIAGGSAKIRVARWNGSTWSALGAGAGGPVHALANYDDGLGGGPALFVGGNFLNAGGAPASNIARWNGSTWSPLGTGLSFSSFALTTYDDGLGSGTVLYAGGHFDNAGGNGGNHVAKWNGVAWSPLPPGLNADVYSLSVYDGGSGDGPKLVAGGMFTANGTQTVPLGHVAAWDGVQWEQMGGGIGGNVLALAAHDDGSGTRLFSGGEFTSAGEQPVSNIAAFDGTEWSRVGSERGLSSRVIDLTATTTPPDVGATHYALALDIGVLRLDGAGWTRIGVANSNSLYALRVHDDGSGHELYAGGDFSFINGVFIEGLARWNGVQWRPVGGQLAPSGDVWAIEPLSIAGGSEQLYVGGKFVNAGAGTPNSVLANNIAGWNGTTWSKLGSGVGGVSFPRVTAIASFDDGSGGGVALYAGGEFATAGGVSAVRIARWDGANWSALGSGLNSVPYTFAVFDDGSGSALYVGGNFTTADGLPAAHIARWNGTSWSAVDAGMNGDVWSLSVFDDGTGYGPMLYAGGTFTNASGVTANGLARWNGTSWSAMSLDLATQADVFAMTVFHDGSDSGPDLYVGGEFKSAGSTVSSNIGQWRGCGGPGTRYCFGDGLDPVVTAECPCSNFGDPGHGCANSNASLGGALLTATGTTTPNTVLFRCTSVPNNTLCTFFQTVTDVPAGFVFGDGLRCVNTPLIRFGQQNSGQNGNAANSAEAAPIVTPYGFTRHYQCQYRNPAPGFCPPATFNMSNAYTISW